MVLRPTRTLTTRGVGGANDERGVAGMAITHEEAFGTNVEAHLLDGGWSKVAASGFRGNGAVRVVHRAVAARPG